jgi:hypothetical protein
LIDFYNVYSDHDANDDDSYHSDDHDSDDDYNEEFNKLEKLLNKRVKTNETFDCSQGTAVRLKKQTRKRYSNKRKAD